MKTKRISVEVEEGHRPRIWRIQSINGVVPAPMSWGVSRYHTESALVRVLNAIDVEVH